MDPLAVIQRLGGGHALEELAEALAEVAAEVVATGKPGRVTLVLEVATETPGTPLVLIRETLTRTLPKKAARGAMFFARDGELYREDPYQPRLPFRELDTGTGEIRQPEIRAREEREV